MLPLPNKRGYMRTEEEKVLQSPVKVILGGKEYEIKPLPIKYALPWCKSVIKATITGLMANANVTSESPERFDAAMNDLLIERPEKLVDLFFEYARDLNKDEIMETASLGEIMDAFEAVKEFESRFFGWAIRSASKMATQQ